MSESPVSSPTPASAESSTATAPDAENPATNSAPEPQPSFTKLAMRNMVRKGGKSLFHFSLTAIGLLAVLVGLAYLTR